MRTKGLIKTLYLTLIFASTAASAEVKSLCSADEIAVWSCEAKKKVYSVCASKKLTKSEGHLQYRVESAGKIEFKYPAELLPPRGHFIYGLLPHGAYLDFKNGKYEYGITEDLGGKTDILVSKEERIISTINCNRSTHSLTETSTLERLKSAGIYMAGGVFQ